MSKKILPLALLALLVIPTGVGVASKPSWEAVSAKQVWNRDTYRVAEWNLPPIVDGPFNLGDNVLVQTTAKSCVVPACNERDAWILRNGSAIRVPNVPKDALSLSNYLQNDGRVVWPVNKPENQNVFDVVELDLTSGEKITLAKDIFLNGVETMNVVVSGNEIFLNPTFSFSEPSRVFKHATVFRYDPARNGATLVTKRYNAQHEDLLDVDMVNRRILTKMTFENGDKELFLTKLESEFQPFGESERIVGSYTPKHEDIVGAHIRPDGAVEYFRLFDRHLSTTNNGVKTIQTSSLDEKLNWNRVVADSVFVEGDNMVYVNMAGELSISNPAFGVLRPAAVDKNPVSVNKDQVFYVSREGAGYVYDLRTGKTVVVDYRPIDKFGDAVTGVNAQGSIVYTNTGTDASVDLGYGTFPAMSDARHVYWRGVNGSVFEATIASSPARIGNFTVEAVRVEGGSAIFLVDGVYRWIFTDEATYFTWFKSWDDVKTVAPTYLTRFRDRGPAAYAPGTRLKTPSDARVYVVGRDNLLHWIINERVAQDVYGPSWNKTILDVSVEKLVSYRLGSAIDDLTDWQSL